MILPVILLVITSAYSLVVEVDIECTTCVLVDKTCYNSTYLFDLQAPFRNRVVIHKMAVLRSSNILYYSFEPSIKDVEYYKVGFVNLDNPDYAGVISGGASLVMNFGTFDIDQDNGRIYLGGDDGVFVLDTKGNKLIPFSSRGDIITSLFFKNNVYFVRYEDRGIIVKKGDYFKTLLEYIPVKNFIVSKTDVIVFLNKFGLYVGKGESAVRLSNNAFFRGLTIDLDGVVYAWWIDGIYRVIIEKKLIDSKVVKVAHLPSIGVMAFDNENNILFTSDRALYKMTKTKYNCSLH